MRKLFAEGVLAPGDVVTLSGDDAAHLTRVLRKKTGDTVCVCAQGNDVQCTILDSSPDSVTLRAESSARSLAEPRVAVSLYVGMPKFDKLETVIQKAVELGVTEIVPFIARNSVSKPDNAVAKLPRWQKIAAEAAKQCGRGAVPAVTPILSFKEACARGAAAALPVVCYELGGEPLSALLKGNSPLTTVAFLTGPEGGIAPEEFEQLQKAGWRPCTLGSRILRCETAPLCALAAVMYEAGEY